jgi:hypothetical protein
MTNPTDSEARSVYLRFRRVFGEPGARSSDARKRSQKTDGSSVPFGSNRDPLDLSDVIEGLTSQLGWNSPLARSELLASWGQIVGADTAEHRRRRIDCAMRFDRVGDPASTDAQPGHHAHCAFVPRSRHSIGTLSGTERSLLEKRCQINSRAWPTRYVRLTRQIRSP